MTKLKLVAVLTVMLLVLSQACTDTQQRKEVKVLAKMQEEWDLLHAEINTLGDSLDSIQEFCSKVEKRLKKDALAFASQQDGPSNGLAALTISFAEDKEKIAEIAAAYEDFVLEWKRLSNELENFREKLNKNKLSQAKIDSELSFLNETLMNAETIVAGLKAALEESAISVRHNYGGYESQLKQNE